MTLITLLKQILTGSALSFMWKVVRNWGVLSSSLKAISDTLEIMHKDGRNLPNTEETQNLTLALSNIIKTEIIDIPGVDEYELAMGMDHFSNTLMLSIEDQKSGKYHEIKVKKVSK